MERHHVFSIVVIAAAITGLTSPFTTIVWIFSPWWAPVWMFGSVGALLFVSMLLVSTTTLLAAGVPAALYERATGDDSSRRALAIWAAGAVAIMLAGLAWRFATTLVPAG